MSSVGGFGLTFKIDISSSLTTIVDVLDGDIPEFTRFVAEMTPHSASGGWATFVATGKRKMEEFSFTVGWDSDETTHAALVTAFNSNNAVDFSVTTPGTDEAIAFSAQITKMGRMSEQEDGMKCEISIQPTGAPTIT